MLALAFTVACEPVPTDEPAVDQTPEFQITSANPMVVSYEGGDYAIDFVSSNPDIATLLSVATEAEWIRIKQMSASESNKIRFAVEANEEHTSRSATIVITHDKEYKVVVNQLPAPEKPKEILSTLDHDVDMVLNDDNTLGYADYFGEDYNSGVGVWQIWLLNVIDKNMICLEILSESQGSAPYEEWSVPTGEFTASDDIFSENVLVAGYRTFDADGLYDGGSWYSETDGFNVTATAPIADGVMNIAQNTDGVTYTVTFETVDDLGNSIKGRYVGDLAIEDFRKN